MRRRPRRSSTLSLFALVASVLQATAATAQVSADGDVVINEIATRGPAGATDEFVELRNTSSDPVDISGWVLERCNNTGSGFVGTQTTVPADTTLEPDGFWLAAHTNFSGDVVPDATWSVGIADDGGARLRDGDTIVDGVGFGTEANNCTLGAPAAALTAGEGDQGLAVTRDADGSDTGDNATDFSKAPATPTSSTGAVEPPPPASCDEPTLIQQVNTVGSDGLPGRELAGQQIAVEAVVTADFGDGLDGFFVQEEDLDAQGATTSSGIFVFAPQLDAPAVGTLVCVTGTVGQFNGLTQLTGSPTVEVVAEDLELPSAVELELPVASAQRAAIAGMRAEVTSTTGTFTVVQNFFQGQFGELDLSATGRLVNPTEVLRPDDPAAAQLRADNLAAQIKLDDANSASNRAPTPWLVNGATRAGDVTGDTLEGVVVHQFGNWRVQPTTPDDIVFDDTVNPRPDGAPDVLSGAADDADTVSVAHFNVLNYFTTLTSESDLARGADTPEELELQAAKIVTAITELDADVVGLVEIENNFGADDDALVDLVERLNTATAPGTYAAIDLDRPVGTDAISNAMIYRPDAVTPVGEVGLAEQQAFVNPRDAAVDRNRPAIAQAFESASGETFVAVVNHLKSKGSGCGAGDDTELQGSCALTRTLTAQELVRWLEEDDPTGTGSDRIAILGDLNSYASEDPIQVLRDAGYVDVLEDQLGTTYSYVFDGELGRLDHTFVSPALAADLVAAAAWHINADEPAAFDYNDWNPAENQDTSEFRSSDHDPIVAGFAFDGEVDEPGPGEPGPGGSVCDLLPRWLVELLPPFLRDLLCSIQPPGRP